VVTMKLRNALVGVELLFTLGLLLYVLGKYFSGSALPGDVFLTFVFFPFSILASVVLFSYYVSIKFGKSIVAYGVLLGLGISLGIFAVKVIPPLMTLGISIYLINRMIILVGLKEIKQLSADFVAEHLVSFQVAALVLLLVAKEYVGILEGAQASPMLLVVIMVWYLFTVIYNARALFTAFRKWSRSE
jgi:hypothetical protein